MNRVIVKYLIIFLFLTSSLYSLDDENDLNLQAPKKLNQIEGSPDILKAIKKDEVVDNISLPKDVVPKNLPDSGIDTSTFTKVKLIDAVLETLSHSDLLKSAREKVIQYEIKVKNAMADYYPTIDFEYNYGKTRTTPSGEDGVKFKYYKDRTYSLTLSQNLYNGGGTGHNLDSVLKRLEVSKNQYRITLDDEIKKSIKAYFDVVFANRSVMVNERNMKKLNKILQIVTIKYDNGAASIGDLTSIKANVANSMTKLVKVQSKFIEALRYYEYIVGVDFEKTLPFEMNFDVSIGDFEELYKRALEKNRDLVNYYKTIEVEKFNQKTSEAAFKPKVDFELSYEKTLDGEDLEEEETDINGQVTFSYNLFNGGKDKNKVLEKSSAIRDLKYRLSEEKRKLKWNLSKVHTSITSVSQALTSTITEIKSSRKMVTAYWDAFKLGEQDLNTLLQGQRQLNSAESELVDYEKSHVTDFFNILELTGDLSSFFDVDPESPKFIDFSKSDYKRTIIAEDGEKVSLDKKDISKIEEKDDILKEEIKEEPKDIPLPKTSIDENINNFLEKFKDFDDESFMIEISSFGNIYDSFTFIKENNFDMNSFSFDVLNNLKIESRVAHNNFATIEEAKEYLKALEAKELGYDYKIKKVKDIKSLYEEYKNGLKIKEQKPKVKIKTKVKIVEKVRQPIKKEEFLPSEEFKNKFLNADAKDFTINVSSFTDINELEKFVIKNNIYNDSFFFKYGNNGEVIKLVNGVYKDYKNLQENLNKLTKDNKDLFPIAERIGLIKKSYENNLELNTKKIEPIEYEYINLSKEKKEKYPIKKEIKKEKIEKKKDDDGILTLTKRPSLEDINRKKDAKLAEVKKEIKEVREELLKEKEIEVINEIEEEKNIEKVQLVSNKEISINTFEEKFLSAPREYYTTSLASFENIEDAKKFIKINKLEVNNTLLLRSNSKKIMVISGIYSTRDNALNAIENLSKNLKRNNPYIQRIYRAQESYRKNNLNEKTNLEEKRLAEEKAELERKEKERLAKEKAKKEAEAKRIAEEKRLAEIKKQEELKRIEEAKKAEKLRLKKIAEEKAELERQEKERLAKEKAKKEAEAKRIAEEKRLSEVKKQEKVIPQTNIFATSKPVEEIDFAQGLTPIKKKVEIPYSKRLELFKKEFYKASKNKYTLRLTRIDSNKVKWYAHRFGLDPNYVVILKQGKKSIIYYGIFNTVEEAKKKTETLHPLIYESKPPVKRIGTVR